MRNMKAIREAAHESVRQYIQAEIQDALDNFEGTDLEMSAYIVALNHILVKIDVMGGK